jgi:hypothetical protein
MFPNVRILIAAVVASVVALSCGFAMFAALRVNHEPLSRLANGAAPLQLAAGNPIPSVAMPAPVDSFGNRSPLNQADSAGASPEAPPRQPDHDNSVEPPSAVASTTATAPETGAAEPAQPAPVALAPAAEPDAKPDEVAVAPNEPPPAPPSEPAPVATETAVTEPPAEQAAPAKPAAPTEQASQEPNPDTKPDTATTAAAEPPPPEGPHKAAHRHRLAAKAQRARQARAIAQPASQPAGIGGPFVPPPSRLAARPQHARQARTIVQPISQPSAIGGPFVPPTNH